MSIDEHLKALKALNRAMVEDSRVEWLERLRYHEAEGNEYSAQYYRDAVAEADARLAAGKF